MSSESLQQREDPFCYLGKCPNVGVDMRKGFSLPKEHSSKTKYSGSKRNPSPHLPAENRPVRLFFSGQGTENALMWNFSQTKVDGCDYILQIPPDWEAAGELEQWHLQVKLWTIKHKECFSNHHIKQSWVVLFFGQSTFSLSSVTHRMRLNNKDALAPKAIFPRNQKIL